MPAGGRAGGLDAEILITVNIPEPLPFVAVGFPWPVRIVENASPKGFGANHNAAFRLAKGEWFCVMNPDIRMPKNPFPVLLGELARLSAAVIAPAVLTPAGQVEDSVRHFPAPWSLAGKMLGGSDGRYRFALGDETFAPDWVGGMFMLFRADDYRAVGGFDEGFFLYEEDAELCRRLRGAGWRIAYTPQAEIVHRLGRSAERAGAAARRAYRDSQLRYYRKWNGPLATLLLRPWHLARR